MKPFVITTIISFSLFAWAIPGPKSQSTKTGKVQSAAMEGPTAVCFNYSGQSRLQCIRSVLMILAAQPDSDWGTEITPLEAREIEELALEQSEL